jgi:NADPH-dependent curcumin reductase CurA
MVELYQITREVAPQVVGDKRREGRLSHTETIVDGLDRAPDAFINLFHGGNTGKMIVRL